MRVRWTMRRSVAATGGPARKAAFARHDLIGHPEANGKRRRFGSRSGLRRSIGSAGWPPAAVTTGGWPPPIARRLPAACPRTTMRLPALLAPVAAVAAAGVLAAPALAQTASRSGP